VKRHLVTRYWQNVDRQDNILLQRWVKVCLIFLVTWNIKFTKRLAISSLEELWFARQRSIWRVQARPCMNVHELMKVEQDHGCHSSGPANRSSAKVIQTVRQRTLPAECLHILIMDAKQLFVPHIWFIHLLLCAWLLLFLSLCLYVFICGHLSMFEHRVPENMASATGVPENNPARDEEEPLLGRPGDVTQQPEQGFQWNLLTGRSPL